MQATSPPRCTLEGCTDLRHKQGYCQRHGRQLGVLKPLAECAVEGCPRKGRTTREGSKCRKHEGGPRKAPHLCIRFRCAARRLEGQELCELHVDRPPGCTVRGCVGARHEDHELCHRHYLRSLDTEAICLIDKCGSLRFRARLCGKHATLLAHEIAHCAFQSCDAWVWKDSLCGVHADIGLDFAAGDWFDWVAVEQMFAGRCDKARRPTALEVLALVKRAERDDMLMPTLAERLGVPAQRLERWRYHAERLAPMLRNAA